jgi:hypothetical protein
MAGYVDGCPAGLALNERRRIGVDLGQPMVEPVHNLIQG